MMMPPRQTLVVNVIQAEGLQHMNHFTGDHPYCVCEVKHVDPSFPTTKAAFGPDRSYYDGAAILLLKVCGCHPSIFGVILSSPSDETMGSAFCPASKARYPSFANSSIRLGGPVGPHWTLLHGRDDVGAMQVSTGVYIGGSLSQYQRLVLQGTAAPSDVNFYSGYSAWPIERLQREVAAGDWTVLKPSAPLLLDAARGAAAARDVLSLAVAK